MEIYENKLTEDKKLTIREDGIGVLILPVLMMRSLGMTRQGQYKINLEYDLDTKSIKITRNGNGASNGQPN